VLRDDGTQEGGCLEADELDLGAACESDRDCDSGACLGSPPVCVPRCDAGNPCDDTLRCVLDGVRRVCVPPGGDGAAGAACVESSACVSGTCIEPPGEDDGGVCVDNCEVRADCPIDGDACVRLLGGARVCLEPLDDGLACQAADACDGGHCVVDFDGASRCASECEDDGTCDDGAVCAEVTETVGGAPAQVELCLPPLDDRAAGEACESARQCQSGLCIRFPDDIGELCAEACAPDNTCEAPLVCYDGDDVNVCGPPA
jgi:hypothetical protein